MNSVVSPSRDAPSSLQLNQSLNLTDLIKNHCVAGRSEEANEEETAGRGTFLV